MKPLDGLKEHITKIPKYSYLKNKKYSYPRYFKFKVADWLMEGQLKATSDWLHELLKIVNVKWDTIDKVE